MIQGLSCIFPVPDLEKTAAFYERLGFRAARYLESREPHICLYGDDAELILTSSGGRAVLPNRVLYGYGYDAYLYTADQHALYGRMADAGVKIARALGKTDYGNLEFVMEDADGRWIAFGEKQHAEAGFVLECLPGAFTVCQLEGACPVVDAPFRFFARTDTERSLVCPTDGIPEGVSAREDGWRGLRIQGMLDFALVGVLARLTGVLSRAGVSVFAVSTYDTDYLFLRETAFDRALAALRGAGYPILEGGK